MNFMYKQIAIKNLKKIVRKYSLNYIVFIAQIRYNKIVG